MDLKALLESQCLLISSLFSENYIILENNKIS